MAPAGALEQLPIPTALDRAGWVLNLSGKPTNQRCIVALDILENLTQGKAGALWRSIGFPAC